MIINYQFSFIIDHSLQNNSIRVSTHVEKEKGASRPDGPPRRDQNKQSIMEKQVLLDVLKNY